MLSKKSIITFIFMNSILILISYLQYILLIDNNYVIIYVILLLKDIIMERGLFYSVYNKPNIYNKDNIDRNIIKYDNIEYYKYLLLGTIVESLTYITTINIYNLKESNIINDLIMFIPISFIYELIFDLGHYLTHRMLHKIPLLYKYVHKIHHKYVYCSTKTTHYHHPVDLLITNSIPHLIAFGTLIYICSSLSPSPSLSPFLSPSPSLFQLNLLLIYKYFIELSGHCGKILNATSFPQCIWLPKIFNIELKPEDHDLHHTLNNCNYSKRFKLWDKVFNTYKNK